MRNIVLFVCKACRNRFGVFYYYYVLCSLKHRFSSTSTNVACYSKKNVSYSNWAKSWIFVEYGQWKLLSEAVVGVYLTKRLSELNSFVFFNWNVFILLISHSVQKEYTAFPESLNPAQIYFHLSVFPWSKNMPRLKLQACGSCKEFKLCQISFSLYGVLF